MDKQVTLSINGQSLTVPEGTLLAIALAQANITRFRHSVKGEPRGPLCAMGTCFECRVTINGKPHQRSCQTLCRHGMEVTTDE